MIISKISDEWRQNSRLRIGGWLILIILMSYAIMRLSDLEDSIKSDYQRKTRHLEELKSLTNQKEWINRADAAKAIIVQMESKLWRANSRGLAQANVQIWVDNFLKEKHITEAQTQVEPAHDITGYEGIWQVSAKIDAAFNPRQLADLLYAVESHQQLVVIEQLDAILNEMPRFTLVMKFYFQANSS